MKASRHARFPIGRSILVILAAIGSAACSPPNPPEGSTSPPESATTASVAADPLDGVWSTGPVAIADIRAAMLAAGLAERAVEGWIEDQGSPPELTFRLRFDSPDFAHSGVDPDSPLQVDESGTYAFADGQLTLSISEAGDELVFDAALTDDTLALELVDVREIGTVEDRAVHLLYTVALYASAPFMRQS